MVRWYLHTARVLRTWGAVGGFLLPPLIGAAFGSDLLTDILFPLVFCGYLAGALYAELALVRPVTGARRVAALVPRELGDYLPRRLLLAQRFLGLAALAVAAIVVVDVAALPSGRATGSPALTACVSAGLAALLAFALPIVERWLVQRPQPFSTPDLVAADNAIRSQSVHSLAGSGLAAQLVCLAGTFSAWANSDLDGWRAWLAVPSIACLAAAIWVCLYYGHRAWRVRRAVLGPATA